MTSKRLLIANVSAALLLMAISYAMNFWILGIGLTVLAAVFWSIGLLKAKNWSFTIGFIFNLLSAAFMNFNGYHPLISLGIVVLSLAAWDLSRFTLSLEKIHPLASAARIERVHLRRLGITLFFGTIAGLAADLIHYRITFTTAAILGLVVIVALSLAARELIHSREPDTSTPSNSS